MKLDIEKVRLAQARSGHTLSDTEKMLLTRARQGKEIRPQTLHNLAIALNCDPEYLIVREVTP